MKACHMCFNARLDDELTDDNDLSYHSIGTSVEGNRLMIASGDGEPLRILLEEYNEGYGWYTIGKYYPKFCPNCGREIVEYNI